MKPCNGDAAGLAMAALSNENGASLITERS
jgi:hypothetical protein